MKHCLTCVICTLLALACLAGCAAPAVAPTKEAPPASTAEPAANPAEETSAPEEGGLPAIGDTFSGFTVTELVPMAALGATGVVYTHEKSGATLLYLACEDTNRSFDISFRTPALDDKGKPHVFEHITICGSQKYPDANMFFPFSNQTYNTYANAFTYHGMTSYPVASLSEEQLMSMMDYYLSGVFEPLLYTEPKLAQREAWRYELADGDADLNIAGTVYSEMQGALTLSALASYNNMKTLYEGSATAYESGGVPDAIRTLTYEELIAFHDTYYHPSNALITLYGDLDIGRFLTYIDSEYLSKYDKKDISVDMGKVAPYMETKYAEYEVAVEKDAVTDNASEIYYSFALNGADLTDSLGMATLLNVVLMESSPVMQALREKLPEAQFTGNMDFDSPSAPDFSIIAKGVNPEDRDVFVAAVDEGLKALAADGISADVLDSILAAFKLSFLTAQEDQNLGVDASLNISLGWVYFGNVNYYAAYGDMLDDMTKEHADTLFKRYITENPHRAVSITKPVPGLTEQNAAKLADELAETKAALSPAEVDELVTSSKAFIEWGNTPASDEIISSLANVDVAGLPEERRHYDVTDETADNVRYLSVEADVSGVLCGKILLDGSTIPIESLQDVQLCLWLMGNLDTASHTKEELSTLMTRYLTGFSSSLNTSVGMDGNGSYAAQLTWNGLTEDAEPSMALLKELLTDTDFSDTATIKNLLIRWSTDFTNGLDSNVLTLQLYRSLAMFNDYYAYREHVDDFDMYAHEQELIALADSDPAKLTERLNGARTLLLNRFGANVLLTGSGDAIAAYRKGVEDILSAMTNEEREKVDYSVLRIPKRNEGIVVNSTVQMNVLVGPYTGYSGKDAVTGMLIDDAYLLPQLRNALGAYGAFSYLDRISSGLYTYRDPNLAGSYDIFARLPAYLKQADLTQADVDDYIIGSYSNLSRPLGLLSGGMQVMSDRLIGYSEEQRLQWMKDAKATTVADIAASAEVWEALIQNGVRSTSGTESKLLGAGDLFDVLLYPDGTVKELTPALAPAA